MEKIFLSLKQKNKKIDLGINYFEDHDKNLIKKLQQKLNEIKPDIKIFMERRRTFYH